MRGRKPKPTYLKLVTGNPGKRALPKGEPKPEIAVPEPPTHLTETALAEWHRVVPLLIAMGALARVDRSLLGAYCVAYGRWVEAEEQIAKLGPIVRAPRTGVPQINPFLSVANKALEQVERFGAKFGMSPQDRARLSTSHDNKDATDPAEKYF